MLRSEQMARQEHEQQVRAENERRWESMKKLGDEDITNLKDTVAVGHSLVLGNNRYDIYCVGLA